MKYTHVRMPDLAQRNKKRNIALYIKIFSVLANIGTVGEMMEQTAGQYQQGIKD